MLRILFFLLVASQYNFAIAGITSNSPPNALNIDIKNLNSTNGKKAAAKTIRLLGEGVKQQTLQHFAVRTDNSDTFSACASFNANAPVKKTLALEKKLAFTGNGKDASELTATRVEQCNSTTAVSEQPISSANRQPLIFRTLDRQRYSGISSAQSVTINDALQWQEFWSTHFDDSVDPLYSLPFPAPEVDFSSQMVIGVFLGTKSCYAVDIENVDLIAERKIVVSYRENAPAQASLCKDSHYAPGHLIVVERSDLPVEFNKLPAARAALPMNPVNGLSPWYLELIDENFDCPFLLPETEASAFCSSPESFHDKVLVKDAMSWQTVWQGYFGAERPLPEIDFATNMVAGIHISGGGCAIEARIESIEQVGDQKILINYSRTALPICAYGYFAKLNWYQIPKSHLPVELNLVQPR
ncbi:hypothetical protein [Methylomonas rhizoryzae]|uniref:hypothetical protein n=1 Tax=Methylomonas rhizoryzae TaxID=2608981 RepID=UPI00123196BB|nr:hypothetical protein [Methylomonas rhizoryzae]